MIHQIDINCDMGEGIATEKHLMPLISSCSIACGGHFGNRNTIKQSIQLALENGVKVGAHPSFPDKDHFGRQMMTLTKRELYESLSAQLQLFYLVANQLKAEVHHVKLHGALYHYAAKDAPAADAVIEAILDSGKRPCVYLQKDSVLHGKAKNLLPLKFEAFIDRRYATQGSLLPRSHAKAMIHAPYEALDQMRQMVLEQLVDTEQDGTQPLEAQTYCIHGDHPAALEILQYIHKNLASLGIQLQ